MTDKKPSFSECFPETAAILGSFRKEFGAVHPIYAKEGGEEVGAPSDESHFTVVEGKDICTRSKKNEVNHGK